MSGQLGDLVVSVRADLARWTSDMGKMQKSAQDSANKIAGSMGGLNASVRKVGAAFSAIGVGLSVGAIAALTKQCIDAGIAAEKMEVQLRAAFGSATEGGKGLAYIRNEAERLGLNLQSAAPAFAKFAAASRGTAIEGEGVRKVFSGISEAAAAMQLSTEESNGIFLALSQMMSKGKVSAEELNGQLGERLPGATKLAAQALGLTTAELLKQMQAGKIMSEDLLPKLANELHKTYGVAAVEAANSAQGQINRFNNSLFETRAAVGAALIPAMNDILTSMRPVIDTVKEAVRSFMQLSVSYAAGIDKISAAKEVGWFGLMTQAGRDKYRRSAAAISEAANAQMAEIDKRFSKTSAGVALSGNYKPAAISATGKGSGASKAEVEAKRIAALNERIQEQIARASKDQLALIDLEAAKYLKEGADRILIEKWVATEKDKINTEAMKGAWKKLEDSQKERVAYEKEQAQLVQANALAEIGSKLALVDVEEQYYKLTAGEAAAKRIAILNEQLALHQKIRDEVVGFGPEAQALRLQEQKEIDGINARLLEQNKIITDRTAMGGFQNALQDYIDSARNMGKQIQDATTAAFQGMEDAIVDFVKTGKLNFSSLVDSIISDLARIAVRQAITAPLASGLSSAISGWFGSGVNIDTWGGLPGGLLGGYATGTNYVPETGPYLLHKGEAVIPADKNSGGLTINVPVSVAGNNALASDLRNEIERTVIDVVRRHS